MSDQEIIRNSPQLSIVVIATNRYVEFLSDLLRSIADFVLLHHDVEVIIFTDEVAYVTKLKSEISRINVLPVEIPELRWPDATLLRYKLIVDHRDLFTGKYIMYLDADTVVVNNISLEMLEESNSSSDISLVLHPGYFQRSLLFSLALKTKFGPWESRHSSSAFVPFSGRNEYVCGGVWFGKRQSILNMVSELSDSVRQDQKLNIIAKWHDESHLNMWLSKNGANLLEPRWAFAPGYANLEGLDPIILVIEKHDSFKNSKTQL
jgi:hypothetical protein